MTARTRAVVAALVLGAVLGFVLLLAYAGHACAVDQPSSPCPDAAAHRATVVALASLSAGLLVTPFALLAEFAVRRRILYRGAWGRATRRGTLTALGIAAIAGLRLGDALSVPSGLFVISLLAAMEWLAVRRFDLP